MDEVKDILDGHQDIANSKYADMLNDDERNRAYDAAIRFTVATMVKSCTFNPNGNKTFHCCDIGTGSGLLSMMIVRAFKDMNYNLFRITSFETFPPMARCAHEVVRKNNMSEHITIIPTRSDEVAFGEEEKIDLLVAELLDTELIGEGCLSAYRHAISNLCSKNCLFIPHKANVYIQPVASSSLFARQSIDNYEIELDERRTVNIIVPESVKNCPGLSSIDDIQASQLVEDNDFYKLTNEPILIFQFTFNKLEELILVQRKEIEVILTERITQPPVLVMWWDIIMYNDSFVDTKPYLPADELDRSLQVLSCAPYWARSNDLIERDKKIESLYKREVWREHWIQGIYYFKNIKETKRLISEQPTQKERKITIIANHDDYSWWFDIKTTNSTDNREPSVCVCGVHRKLTRSQLTYLNDKKEMKKLLKSYFGCPHTEKIKFPIKACLEFQGNSYDQAESTADWRFTFRNLRNQPILSNLNRLEDLGYHTEHPWKRVHNLLFRNKTFYHPNNYITIPSIAPIRDYSIKCTQVIFDNLNRIRLDVDNCEGFDVSPVDNMINLSVNYTGQQIEHHYLWEYPCKRVDKDYVVYSTEIDGERHEIARGTYWKNLKLPINCRGPSDWKKGWAIVIWAEFCTNNTSEIISTGPTDDKCRLFEKINWNKHFRQSIYFMHNHPLTQVAGRFQDVSIDIGFLIPNLAPTIQRAIDYNTSIKKQ